MARLRVAQRRSSHENIEPVIVIDQLKIDLSRRQVSLDNQDIPLTPTEYDLLRMFATNAGKVITHTQLLRKVWGTGYENELHILRVNISNLRRKIEPDPTRPYYITTEPGVGYRMRIGKP